MRLTDLISTFASAANFKLPDNAGQDSVDLLPVLTGTGPSSREATLHTGWKASGYRKGDFKFIDSQVSGGFTEVEVPVGAPPGQLYNLRQDIGETRNLYNSMPEKVEELRSDYEAIAK